MTREAEERAKKARREIPSPPPATLRASLEWLLDHEDDLPKDNPTLLLKTVGKWWSMRMAEAGVSSKWYGLYEEIDAVVPSKDGFEYDRRTKRLTNTRLSMGGLRPVGASTAVERALAPGGWMLKTIMHTESSSRIQGGKYEYAHISKRTGKAHRVYWAKYAHDEHYALFWLCGKEIFYFEAPKPPDVSLAAGRTQFHSGFFLNAREQEPDPIPGTSWLFEAVLPKAACCRYMRLDCKVRSCAVEVHFTNSHRIDHYFSSNRSDARAMMSVLEDTRDLKCLVNYDAATLFPAMSSWEEGREVVEDFQAELDRLADPRPALLKPHLSALLTKQLRARLSRMGRKLLITNALELEEIRARDPVKRCAACAVQAVKDQLVLGLEPPAKRPCVV